MATGPSGHWLDGSSASGEGLPGAVAQKLSLEVWDGICISMTNSSPWKDPPILNS